MRIAKDDQERRSNYTRMASFLEEKERAAKALRSGVDFDNSELRSEFVAALIADPAAARAALAVTDFAKLRTKEAVPSQMDGSAPALHGALSAGSGSQGLSTRFSDGSIAESSSGGGGIWGPPQRK